MNSKLPQRCVSSLSRKTKVLDWSEPAWLLWTLCEVASTREDWCRDSEFRFPLVFSKMRVYDWVYLAEHRALLEINFSRFLWYKTLDAQIEIASESSIESQLIVIKRFNTIKMCKSTFIFVSDMVSYIVDLINYELLRCCTYIVIIKCARVI